MRKLQLLLRLKKHQISILKKGVARADITLDQIQEANQLDNLFDEKTQEQRLYELYDQLVEQGYDTDLINTVFNRLSG